MTWDGIDWNAAPLVDGYYPAAHKRTNTGTFWLDSSEIAGGGDCDLCGSPHYAITCPACGTKHETFQGDDRVDCRCGAVLRISDLEYEAFAAQWGG